MSNKKNKSWSIELEYCEYLNEFYIKFPEDLGNNLDWEEGDTLKWEILDDETVIVKKVKAED